jgi:Zn-dependent protease with chaperone function
MRALLPVVAAVALLAGGCATIHGYPVRESRGGETPRVGEILDPLLAALELPSLRAISASRCKIGFAVVRTDKVNVWSTPGTTAPCLHFSLFVTEGALDAPADELTAMIAHELGHLMLQHTPQSQRQRATSSETWQSIQLQELEADRFAVALLKQLPASSRVACEAMGRFLRRGAADWYGDAISPRMEAAVSERAERSTGLPRRLNAPARGGILLATAD